MAKKSRDFISEMKSNSEKLTVSGFFSELKFSNSELELRSSGEKEPENPELPRNGSPIFKTLLISVFVNLPTPPPGPNSFKFYKKTFREHRNDILLKF